MDHHFLILAKYKKEKCKNCELKFSKLNIIAKGKNKTQNLKKYYLSKHSHKIPVYYKFS